MKLTYPAVFAPFEDGTGYTVTVPDLPGCVIEGNTLADAILMAEDAASGWVLDELEDGKKAPDASPVSKIAVAGDEFVSVLALDIDSYAEKYGSKAVRKNLSSR
jgi:predicted RNase H-like HicB family nuclease